MIRNPAAPGSLIGLVLLALLAGCGGDNGTDVTDGDSIVIPLAVGNFWIYEESSTGKRSSVAIDTTTIVDAESLGGETWYLLASSLEQDTVRVREDGQELFILPALGDVSGDDPAAVYLRRVIEESAPWKYADFDAAVGSEWTLAAAETTFELPAGEDTVEATLRVSFEAASEGRTTTSVPAGEFSGVYHGTVRQLIIFSSSEGADSMRTMREVWIADRVGIVRTEEVSTNPSQEVETITEILQSYHVE
jgi:hypothetical protein